MPNPPRILETIGEGKSDIGPASGQSEPPGKGVVPVLIHRLCGRPPNLRVKRRPPALLQGKGWWQKVRFAKLQAHANGSAGVVFVLDTEGDQKGRLDQLTRGRDSCLPNYPMAIGAPHPCLEVWLLADAVAIAQAMNLASLPSVPATPEALPAPQRDRRHNPKAVLARCAGATRAELSAEEKTRIAAAMQDLSLLSQRCPSSFAPFAAEVEHAIKPLFA